MASLGLGESLFWVERFNKLSLNIEKKNTIAIIFFYFFFVFCPHLWAYSLYLEQVSWVEKYQSFSLGSILQMRDFTPADLLCPLSCSQSSLASNVLAELWIIQNLDHSVGGSGSLRRVLRQLCCVAFPEADVNNCFLTPDRMNND